MCDADLMATTYHPAREPLRLPAGDGTNDPLAVSRLVPMPDPLPPHIAEAHTITVGHCGEEKCIHLVCTCEWLTDDHIMGERIGALIVMAADHWREVAEDVG